MWDPSMVPALEELALLRDRLLDGKASVASEVRLRSDSFGLTPKGRQQLRWLIETDDQFDEFTKRRREGRSTEPAS